MMDGVASSIEDAMCRAIPVVLPAPYRGQSKKRVIAWRRMKAHRLTLHPLAKTRYMKPIGPRRVRADFAPIIGAERMTRGVLARAIGQSDAEATTDRLGAAKAV